MGKIVIKDIATLPSCERSAGMVIPGVKEGQFVKMNLSDHDALVLDAAAGAAARKVDEEAGRQLVFSDFTDEPGANSSTKDEPVVVMYSRPSKGFVFLSGGVYYRNHFRLSACYNNAEGNAREDKIYVCEGTAYVACTEGLKKVVGDIGLSEAGGESSMAEVVQLEDVRKGRAVAPRTLTTAVYDENGKTVEERLASERNETDAEISKFYTPTYNIFTDKNATENARINANTGEITPDNSFNLTDYIEVKGNTAYAFQVGDSLYAHRVYAFDAGRNYIKGEFKHATVYHTSESCRYIRVAYENRFKDVMISEGNHALPYKPNRENSAVMKASITDRLGHDKTKIIQQDAVTRELRRLFRKTYNLLDINASLRNIKPSANLGDKEWVAEEGTDTSELIEVENGRRYLFQTDRQTPLLHYANWYAYDMNGDYLKDGFAVKSERYLTPAGCRYIRVAYPHDTDGSMVVLADEVQPYVNPYVADVTGLSLSAMKNDVPFAVILRDELVMPRRMYGFAGHPVRINLPNVIPYNWNDIYYSVVSQNLGELRDKMYYYEAAAAKDIQFISLVYNHDYQELNYRDRRDIIIRDKSIKQSLDVLVIGDSTVNHHKETQVMLDLASADGYGLKLLGTRGNSPTNQHEGRGGWTAKMFYDLERTASGTVNAFYNPQKKVFDFAYYMQRQGYTHVDVVFWQLGINDVLAVRYDSDLQKVIDEFVSCYKHFIKSIHDYDANIKIIINLTIPCNRDQNATAQYTPVVANWRSLRNGYLLNKRVIHEFDHDGSDNVWVSWYNASIDGSSQIRDNVHPTDEGYACLGEQMYAFMRAIN